MLGKVGRNESKELKQAICSLKIQTKEELSSYPSLWCSWTSFSFQFLIEDSIVKQHFPTEVVLVSIMTVPNSYALETVAAERNSTCSPRCSGPSVWRRQVGVDKNQ